MLTSCSDDELGYDVGNNEVKEVTVSLKISAGEVGDISVTRADYEDENALDGEYMNSLCVFVVNESNTIVAKLVPSSEDDTYDWEGKTYEWTSEEFPISTGTYTVYAFSNWETITEDPTDESGWSSIIAKDVDDPLTDENLNIDIEDPASLVDIENGKYIPMSGSATINVTEGSTSFDVGMDRLVGRVEITIYGESGTDAEDVTLNSFTFGNLANIVPLMSDGTKPTTITYENNYTIDFVDKVLHAVNTDEESTEEEKRDSITFYFYVNETSNTNGFDISLSITRESGESTYTATTTTTNIPRNNVYPLLLSLDPYSVRLTVSAYTSILGMDGYLLYSLINLQEYTLTENPEVNYTGEYSIRLYDITSKYTISPTLWKVGDDEPIENVNWKWNTSDDELEIDTINGTLTATCLTATPDYKYEYSLTATWENSSSSTSQRSYNINVTFIDSEDMPIVTPLSSRSWKPCRNGYDVINLIKKED